MARIPEGELERLKRETDLVALVQASGVELRRHGADWVGRCPYHEDRNPSLVVTPSKGLWHCLGACQMGGTVIDWVMKRDGVSFRHAVEVLLAGNGNLGKALEDDLELDPEASDAELLGQVAGYYHATLKRSPEAIEYLRSRGLDSVALIDRFRLGYANRTLGYRLPKKVLKAGERIRGRLQALGVLRESGHEHLRGSLVVPIENAAGQVVQLYGRKLNDHLREGTPLHLYLPGPHRGLWNRAGLMAQGEVILCESLVDAMTFWGAGYENVTTSYRVNGFTEGLRNALLTHARRVLIAFDRDEAGDKAARKVAEQLQAGGIECYRVLFPRGMDANGYALEVRPASKSLGVVIQAAEWLGLGPVPQPAEASAGSVSLTEGDAPAPEAAPEPLSSLAAPTSDPETSETSEPAEPAASPAPRAPAEPLVPLEVTERVGNLGRLFLTKRGRGLTPKRLGALVSGYVEAAALGKRGSCHVFRHTMATLMLEGGADVRHIQEILGHAQLSTTALYTHLSIAQLQDVHRRTHPARMKHRTDEP